MGKPTKLLYRGVTTRRLTKMVETRTETPTGGHSISRTWIDDGTEQVWFEVLLDEHEVCSMANRAAGNKKQTCDDGALRVRVYKRDNRKPGTGERI